MTVWKPLAAPRLLAAIGALCVPLLAGCATTGLLMDWPRERFVGIRGAYLRPDELGIQYATRGYGGHDQIAWFQLRELRKGPVKLPYVVGPENRPMWSNPESEIHYPERVERGRGAPPEDAKALPLGRGAPRLPPRADIAVFVPPKGEELEYGHYGRHVAIVVVVSENGQVYKLGASLPCSSFRPWHRYPFVPVAVVFDVVTFPLQLLVFSTLLRH